MVPWSYFMIPVPDGYEDRTSLDGGSINGAPIATSLEIAPRDDNKGKSINPMLYRIVGFGKGSNEWLNAIRANADGKQAVNERTIKSVTVADYPGLSYEPQRSDNGQTMNYVIDVDATHLLLITIDKARPEQTRSITAIERSTSTGPQPATTTTPSANGPMSVEVAYVLERDIWLHDIASEKSRQITKLGNVREFAWSPDGRRIAFAAGEENNTDIWSMDLRNGKQTAVTSDDKEDSFPAYAPDGTLYFVRRNVDDDGATLDIVKHAASKDTVVHSEPGGLVGPTGLRFHTANEWALGVSTGRGSYVLLGKVGEEASKDLAGTYLPESAGCAYDIAWHEREAMILSSIDCVPHENSTISRLTLADKGAVPTTVHTGAGIRNIDWAADGAIVWSRNETGSQTDGIWVITGASEPQRIVAEGMQPLWRP